MRPPRLRSVSAAVRVKRCGKSAPRPRQRGRHGKPHREQDRIGTTSGRKLAGPSGPVVRVGCARRRATGVPEEWPSRGGPAALQNPAYRPADTSNGGSAEKPPGPRQFQSSILIPKVFCGVSWDKIAIKAVKHVKGDTMMADPNNPVPLASSAKTGPAPLAPSVGGPVPLAPSAGSGPAPMAPSAAAEQPKTFWKKPALVPYRCRHHRRLERNKSDLQALTPQLPGCAAQATATLSATSSSRRTSRSRCSTI